MTILKFPLMLREKMRLDSILLMDKTITASDFSMIPTIMQEKMHVAIGNDIIMMQGGKQ